MKSNNTLLSKINVLDLICGILLTIFIMSFSWLYVYSENTFYFWDYSYYHITTLIKGLEYYNLDNITFDNVIHELKVIWGSSYHEYSDYFKLPIIPLVLLFGDSREVYISSITIIYLLPLIFSISYLATSVIQSDKRNVFWITTAVAVLTPSLWIPTLKGFPDSFAVSLVCLSSAVYLKGSLIKYKDIILISFCFVVAVLFRRHISYDVLTFFLVVCILAIFSNLVFKNNNSLFSEAKKIVLVGLCSLFMLLVLGWPFVQRIVYSNTDLHYPSWHRSVFGNIAYFTEYFGLITIIPALCGLFILAHKKIAAYKAIIFVSLFLIINFLVWIFFVKQTGYQYTLHFTPWIIIGLTCLLFAGKRLFAGTKKYIFVSIFAGFLLLNFSYSLLVRATPGSISTTDSNFNIAANVMLTEKLPPQLRSDYDEVIKLIDYLRKISSPSDVIYVAAVSDILNEDIIGQTNLYSQKIDYPTTMQNYWLRDGHKLNIPYVPFADFIHPYPLELLIKSKYVIVADPLQYHLRLEEHDVLSVVHNIFINNWEFSKDFIKLGNEFYLIDNVRVNVYKRQQETSYSTLIKTLDKMEKFVGKPPGGQLGWMDINPAVSNIKIEKNNTKYDFTGLRFKDGIKQIQFLYINNAKEKLNLSGEIEFMEDSCKGVQVSVSKSNSTGFDDHVETQTVVDRTNNRFQLNIKPNSSSRIILNLMHHNDPKEICRFNIRNLSVI